MDTKPCDKCHSTLPISEFGRNRRYPDGLHKYCRACTRAVRRAYYQKHKAFFVRKAQHYQQFRHDPDYRSLRLTSRERLKNPCPFKPELQRLKAGIRSRYGKAATLPGITVEEWKTLRERPCRYCRRPGIEIDHLVPIIQGGPHAAWNIDRSCRACNDRKHDQDIVEFAHRSGRLDWLDGLDPRVLALVRERLLALLALTTSVAAVPPNSDVDAAVPAASP